MKGVVKLRFKDVAGSIVVCHRILQSTQKVNSLRAGGRGAILPYMCSLHDGVQCLWEACHESSGAICSC